MAFTNILIPYDMSESSKNAFAVAKEFLETNPARDIHIIYVTAAPDFSFSLDAGSLDTTSQDSAMFVDQDVINAAAESLRHGKQEELEESIGSLEGLEGNITEEVVFDTSPTNGIVNYAEENDIDLIIMGSRGLGAIRGMLGSVSYGVLRAASMPVLIVK